MKKIALFALMALVLVSCESQERIAVDFNQLPAEAQSFVKTHFSDKTISIIFHDKDLFDKDYEVIFEDTSNVTTLTVDAANIAVRIQFNGHGFSALRF